VALYTVDFVHHFCYFKQTNSLCCRPIFRKFNLWKSGLVVLCVWLIWTF